jgi:putative hemolysin
MNIKKNILAAAMIVGLVGSASAANVTYISGSTAFRGSANAALTNYCAQNGGSLIAWDNATIGSAGNLLLSYTNGNGVQYVNVHWNGSEAGNQSAAGPATGVSNAANVSFYQTNAVGLVTTGINNSHTTDLAFSDTYQSTSIFNGKVNGVTYGALSGFDNADGIVGVVAFTFVGSTNFPTNANVTAQVFNQIAAAGNIPLTLLTGNAADNTNSVYLVGRNVDSGTRLTTLAETTYGVRTPVTTYAVATGFTGGGLTTATLSGTSTTNTLILYPVETIDGISSVSAGNSGYGSGGTLCGLMTNVYAQGAALTVAGSPARSTGTNFLLGYAGVSDANGKTNGGLVKLPYNGVSYSTNAIAQGQYTYWGYEHLYVSPNANATAKSFATGLGNQIYATPTSTLSPNLNAGDMQCGRNGDGQIVYSNY